MGRQAKMKEARSVLRAVLKAGGEPHVGGLWPARQIRRVIAAMKRKLALRGR